MWCLVYFGCKKKMFLFQQGVTKLRYIKIPKTHADVMIQTFKSKE